MRAHRAIGTIVALTLLAVPLFSKANPTPTALGSPETRFVVAFAPHQLPSFAVNGTLGGLTVLNRIPQLDVAVVQAPSLTAVQVSLLGQSVRGIQADTQAKASLVPNDPRYPGQYALPMMGLPAAWDRAGYGSSNITIAVIDSGILRTHPDLQNARILTGHDYVDGDATTEDTCGHGTHVAGILAASTNNGIGIAGTTQATLLPLRVLDSSCTGWMSAVAQAIVDATDQGARVISLSLGSPTSDQATSAAVTYAWQHGALVVAAAGNDGSDNSVEYPAAYPEVIAVGAVDGTRQLAPYSSRGPQVEVVAPGSNIDSTYNNGGYATLSGTSMATPSVAGSLALALGCAPATTNQQARTALDGTAQDLGAPGRDTSYGYGLARADWLVQRLCPNPVNQAPLPSFTVAGAGLTRSFDGRASADPDGDAITWTWSFGDGGNGTGSTTQHAYAKPGTYVVTLQVSDGRLSATASQNVTIQAQTFTATITPTKNVNEWWIEVQVTASSPPAAVSATVNGATHALPATSWGTWAASFHVPSGTPISFMATSNAGESATSPTLAWLGPPPPPNPAFNAVFTVPSSVNEWWVAVSVGSNHPLAGVTVSVDGAAPVSLGLQSWGDWARSIPVQQGSNVQFAATDTSGNTAQSQVFAWLVGGAGGPFAATITPTQTTNHWWVEAHVAANQPVQGVQAQINGSPWVDLAKTSWGTWARSLSVPVGSQVAFRATSTGGSTVESATYTWS